jgi:hypothetical protein
LIAFAQAPFDFLPFASRLDEELIDRHDEQDYCHQYDGEHPSVPEIP